MYVIFEMLYFSLTKLMVSHDLRRSTETKPIVFDQRGLHSAPEFERAMDRRCQALVSKLETLDTITFTQLILATEKVTHFKLYHHKDKRSNYDFQETTFLKRSLLGGSGVPENQHNRQI